MIRFYTPHYEDLWFKRELLSDEDTMAFNRDWGGTIPFPPERWAGWFEQWVGAPDRRFYRYLADENGTFMGEAAYCWEEERGIYLADVIVLARVRRQGCGTRALALLCAAAKENGVEILYDEIAADNPAVGLFKRAGFTPVSRTERTVLLAKTL